MSTKRKHDNTTADKADSAPAPKRSKSEAAAESKAEQADSKNPEKREFLKGADLINAIWKTLHKVNNTHTHTHTHTRRHCPHFLVSLENQGAQKQEAEHRFD